MIKHDWCREAEQGLSGTTDNMHRLRARVLRGEAELWRVDTRTSRGWLVTEIFTNQLRVWCYQGTGFVPLARDLARIALSNNLRTLGWFTFHRAAKRLFRHIRPVLEPTDIPGESFYTLNCEALCALPKTLVEPLPSRRSAVTTSASAVTTAPVRLHSTHPLQPVGNSPVGSRTRIVGAFLSAVQNDWLVQNDGCRRETVG